MRRCDAGHGEAVEVRCETCARLEAEIRYQAQRDYRAKMALWAEYEKHRRECHHVLHIAIAVSKVVIDK